MRTIYFDHQFQKVDAQIIDVFTPGVFRAQGVFETMLGLDDVVLDIPLHLKRLKLGLKVLGLESPVISPEVVKEVLRSNQLSCGRVRVMVWKAKDKTHVMIVALPYKIENKKISK